MSKLTDVNMISPKMVAPEAALTEVAPLLLRVRLPDDQLAVTTPVPSASVQLVLSTPACCCTGLSYTVLPHAYAHGDTSNAVALAARGSPESARPRPNGISRRLR